MDELRKILERLYPFVAVFSGYKLDKLTEDTLVNFDLGMTGDDGTDFMEAFAEEFDVDISHFPVRRYFDPEGFGLFSFIAAKLRGEKIASERPLSILRLALAIKDKKW